MDRALITGGTSGIGAAFARELAGRGVDLVLVARNEQRLEDAAADLNRLHGVDVEVLPADLTDRDQAQRVADRIASETAPITILINNAGFSVGTPLSDPDMAAHDRAVEVMLRSVVLLSGAAARTMLPRGRGWILNISSTAGFVTMGAYSALKSWVTAYTESLATELRGSGVTVTAVCPGWVRTEFHERAGIKGSSIPPFLWLDADAVVREALRDAARGAVVSVPSTRFAIIARVLRHAPRAGVRRLSGLLSSRRAGER